MASAQHLASRPPSEIPWSSRSSQTGSWGRNCELTATVPFLPSVCCWAAATCASNVPLTAERPLHSRELKVEKLWRKFFADPSQWWDHRTEKANPKFPDFRHKKLPQSLWIHHTLNPPWVAGELAAIAPGTLQSSIFSWNMRLQRYVEAGDYEKAMETFQQLQREAMNPDRFTFVPILSACANLQAIDEGRRIHLQIIEAGHESDVYVASTLVDMYAKCGSIEDARSVFNKMATRALVTWNALILGYAKCGQGQAALEVYSQMEREAWEPNSGTFVGVLTACASIGTLEEGRRAHKQILDRGLESDVYVASCLVDMYAKCGSMEDARSVFNKMPIRNVVSWSSLILGYVKDGQGQEALELSQQMQREGVDLNPVTFVAVLNACACIGALEEGRLTHEEIIKRGYECNVFVATSLVDMYSKCGSIKDARRVFNMMPVRNVVSWSALILGYVKSGQGQKALELFQQMQQEGLDVNPVTLVGVLNACASIGVLEEGRRAHKQAIDRGYECDVYVVNSVVDMYAKCGSLEDASSVFNKMPMRNVISWNTMLAAYCRHGYAKEALEHFERMCQEVEVDGVSFISLLSACSHGGFVKEGVRYFKMMKTVFNIPPGVEHYACMVDLLGRAGHLLEAEDLIRSMPCEPGVSVWTSLLSACRLHGNLEVGERVAKRVLELEPGDATSCVLLSKLHAAAGK